MSPAGIQNVFFEDCSSTMIEDVSCLSVDERAELFITTGHMFLTALVKIKALRTDRESNNVMAETTLPAVLPH